MNWLILDKTAQLVSTNLTMYSQPDITVLSIWSWTIFQQRTPVSPSFTWTLPWSSYKNGFGSIGRSFWLGLERLHLLTSAATYRLRIELQTTTGSWYSAEYSQFIVDDETANQYRLHVDGSVKVFCFSVCGEIQFFFFAQSRLKYCLVRGRIMRFITRQSSVGLLLQNHYLLYGKRHERRFTCM
jgi:hypothetical protein